MDWWFLIETCFFISRRNGRNGRNFNYDLILMSIDNHAAWRAQPFLWYLPFLRETKIPYSAGGLTKTFPTWECFVPNMGISCLVAVILHPAPLARTPPLRGVGSRKSDVKFPLRGVGSRKSDGKFPLRGVGSRKSDGKFPLRGVGSWKSDRSSSLRGVGSHVRQQW